MNRLGPYVLLDRIATGGMGEIFLASLRREGGFEKAVALKRILPHLADDPAFVKMFEAEARLTALLSHPNIVHIHDFGRVDGQEFIVMELVDGFDLRTLLEMGADEGRPLPVGLALRVASDCARALDHAHTKRGQDGEPLRIIHRDVSPQNVLISFLGETKLTDFGLAKTLSLDAGSLSGMLKGKVAYMPPEQVQGQPLDVRADVFSLGAVLYEMVTGQRLYPPDLPVAELVLRVSEARWRPVADVAPQVPKSVAAVVERCLARDPADRFGSAQATDLALRALGAELGTHETSYDLADYVGSFRSRRRVRFEVQDDGTVVAAKPFKEESPDARADTVAAQNLMRAATDMALADPPVVVGARITRPMLIGAVALALVALAVRFWPAVAYDPLIEVPGSPPPSGPHAVSPVSDDLRRAADAVPALRRARRPFELSGPEAATGVLEVQVDRPGARCVVRPVLGGDDRIIACGAPIELSPGAWHLAVLLAGHPAVTRDVVVVVGKRHVEKVILDAPEPQPCTIALSSDPPGAQVRLDDRLLEGVTPLTLESLSPGEYTLALWKPGRERTTLPLVCGPDTQSALSVVLPAFELTLSVGNKRKTVRPGGALNHRQKFGAITTQVRAEATRTGARFTVSAKPFAQVQVGTGGVENTPARFTLRTGRSRTVTLLKNGVSLGKLTVRVTRPD